MARARRAKPRPARVVVPLLTAAVVVAGVVGWQSRADTAADPQPGSNAVQTPDPEVAGPSPTPGATPDATVTAALTACRTRTSAADDLMAAARTGIGHWAEHVQAQTDANDSVVTVATMDGIFARTRLAGPADVRRYDRARDRWTATDPCESVAAATGAQARALQDCRTRDRAQRDVLEAAAPAMQDWRDHLQAMERSRMMDVPDAEEVWIEAWRAAPPAIRGYDDAVEAFDAPTC